MSREAKNKPARQDFSIRQRFQESIHPGTPRGAFLALLCGTAISVAAATEANAADVPEIPADASKALTWKTGKEPQKLAVVIAVDEQGDYKIYRRIGSGQPTEPARPPVPAGDLFVETFTVLQINPTCIRVGGVNICW